MQICAQLITVIIGAKKPRKINSSAITKKLSIIIRHGESSVSATIVTAELEVPSALSYSLFADAINLSIKESLTVRGTELANISVTKLSERLCFIAFLKAWMTIGRCRRIILSNFQAVAKQIGYCLFTTSQLSKKQCQSPTFQWDSRQVLVFTPKSHLSALTLDRSKRENVLFCRKFMIGGGSFVIKQDEKPTIQKR